jgi:hypothetical protein
MARIENEMGSSAKRRKVEVLNGELGGEFLSCGFDRNEGGKDACESGHRTLFILLNRRARPANSLFAM